MNTTSLYRSAIVGTGAIAHAHAEALTKLSDRISLIAVVDVDAERARAFADQYGIDTIYTDAAELIAAEKLDLVHLCTPPATHVPLAIMAMRAGVAVFTEKPTAPSLAEIDKLAEVERETGVPVLTVFQHRFGRAARRLAQFVKDGTLGRPLVATCETLWFRADSYFDLPWRGKWAVEGGGPTMGHGIHQFDMMLSILGPWRSVSAMAARQTRPTDTEDVSVAVAQFENGALATIVNSIVSPRETSRVRFDFEFATVEVEHLYGYTDADWTFTPAKGHEELASVWAFEGPDEISSHTQQLTVILDAFDAGTDPEVSLVDATRTVEFAAATYASAFRGKPIAAGEITAEDPFRSRMDGGLVPWAPFQATGA